MKTSLSLFCGVLGFICAHACAALEITDLLGAWRHEKSQSIIEFRQNESGIDAFFVELSPSLSDIGFNLDDKLLSDIKLTGNKLGFTVTIRSENPEVKDICQVVEVPVSGQLQDDGQSIRSTINAGEYVVYRNDTNQAVRCLHFPNDRHDPFVLTRQASPIEIETVNGHPYPSKNKRFQLNDIQPFRVRVTYEQPSVADAKVSVKWEGDQIELPLLPTDDPMVFVSEWRYLSNTTMHNYRELGSLLESNTERDYALVKELFAGTWRVSQIGGELGEAFGVAKVAEDGKFIDVYLSGNGKQKHYRSFEIQATKDNQGNQHTLSARFQEISSPPPGGLLQGRENWPLGYILHVPDSTQALRFEVNGKKAEADLAFHTLPPERTRFLLMGRSSGRLAGAWSQEQTDGDLGLGGQHTWAKDSKVEGIVVLEDQTKRRSTGTRSFAYPFGFHGDNSAQRFRTLFIYGKNLPSSYGDALVLQDDDATIEYEFESFASGRRGFEQVWKKAGIDNPEGYDALVLKANLKSGVSSGVKLLTINGAPGAWHLFFADAIGKLSFAHNWRDEEFQATASVFSSDTAYVVIDDMSTIPNKGMEFKIKRNGDEVGRVIAHRKGDPENAEYHSQPIRLYKRDDSRYAPPESPHALSIAVRANDTLEAEAIDPSILALVPAKATVRVHDNPGNLGKTWEDALRRMAACHGDSSTDFSSITMEEAETFSRFILTELSSRNIRITKGDHAAAIIIRDELVSVMREIISAYRDIANDNDQKIIEFIAVGRQKREPFWRTTKGRDGRNNEVSLEALLDYENQASAWGMTAAQARAHAIREVRGGLAEFIGLMDDSVSRATSAGDCNVAELMVIAGQQTEPVVARILPRLVHLKKENNQRYWAPDFVAQGYVGSLHVTGAAIRALEEYSRIDDAYKSMAVALASGGTAFAISGLGYAGAGAYLMIAADVADMAYFGVKGIYEYVEGEALVDYAKGVTPAIGEDFLAEAELASTEWYWAAVGAIAPGISAGVGFKQLKNLRNADAVARGARLTGQLDTLDEAALTRLTDAQRTDMAALYTSLVSKRMKAADSLTELERTQLRKFDSFFDGARPAIANITAPKEAFWPVPEVAAGSLTRVSQPPAVDLNPGGGLPRRTVGTPVETPNNLPTVFKQENCNTCGVAAARSVVARLTGQEIAEQDMIRKAIVSGRGYSTGIDFEAGSLGKGGTTMRQMMDMLEDTGVRSRSLASLITGSFNLPRFLQNAGSEIGRGNQVLAMVNYSQDGRRGVSPHWVTIEKVTTGRVTQGGRTVIEGPYVIIGDPAKGKSVAIAQDDFVKHWRPAETIVALSAENASTATRTGGAIDDILPDGVRGGGPIRPNELPNHLPTLKEAIGNNQIHQADLADLIDHLDRMLYANWHNGSDRVSTSLQHGLNEELKRLSPALREELYTHLHVRMLNRQNFFGTPLRDIAPPELGFSTTTQTMRNSVQGGEYSRRFRQFFDSHEYGQSVGRMEPDHIVPVADIVKLDGFKSLSFENRMNVIHNIGNIQALPSLLNKSKSNLSALEWQAELTRRGQPELPVDYVRWLDDEQRRLKQALQDQIYALIREQENARLH